MLTRCLTRLTRPQGLLATSTATAIRNSASPIHPLSITGARTLASAVPATSTSTVTENVPDHKGSDGGHDGGHGHYNAPGGWLWGQRPGEKYEREGWEIPFYIGFVGSWVVGIIAYTMKEDTSIQTWALEEARRRLEKEGILEDSSE